jgi:hypothetical protein
MGRDRVKPVLWRSRTPAAGPPPPASTYVGTVHTTTAPYQERDGARLEYWAPEDRYLLIAGWWPFANPEWPYRTLTDPGPPAVYADTPTTNNIWSAPSSNLATGWGLDLAHDPNPPRSGAGARFRRRHTFGTVQARGYLWVINSDSSDAVPGVGYYSDIWKSNNPRVLWTEAAGNSPWGGLPTDTPPRYGVYLPVIGWDPTNELCHVLGGVDNRDNTARAEHWTSPLIEPLVWTRRADAPFTIASSTKLVHHKGAMVAAGGFTGVNGAGARNNVTRAWTLDGGWVTRSTTAPWSPRDWVMVADYDSRLWVCTGATPANSGGAWYSDDGGITYVDVSSLAPWLASHADAYCVTEQHGIVVVTGSGQGNRVVSLKRGG